MHSIKGHCRLDIFNAVQELAPYRVAVGNPPGGGTSSGCGGCAANADFKWGQRVAADLRHAVSPCRNEASVL